MKGCEVCSREVCWNLLRELEPCLFWDWFADVRIGEEWIEEGGRLGEIHGQPLFWSTTWGKDVGDGVDRVRDFGEGWWNKCGKKCGLPSLQTQKQYSFTKCWILFTSGSLGMAESGSVEERGLLKHTDYRPFGEWYFTQMCQLFWTFFLLFVGHHYAMISGCPLPSMICFGLFRGP